MPIVVEVDTRKVTEALQAIGENLAGRALRRAIARSTDAATTAGSRAVREDLNVSAAGAKRAMRVRKTNIEGLIYASARPSGLVNFGARTTKRGVSVKIRRGGARELFRHAFIAAGKSGNVQVFERKRVGSGFAKRLPIRSLNTASIASQLQKDQAIRRMRDAAAQVFETTLQHELSRAIGKAAEAPNIGGR